MKNRMILQTGLLFILTFALSARQADKKSIGKITFPLNRVFVISAGSSELKYAQFNMPIYPGDKIETKKESRCELTLNNGDIIRIDENSIFTIEDTEIGEKKTKVESFLEIGKIWGNIRKIFSSDDYFKVKSPSAVIAIRGTVYGVNANKDTTTQVVVHTGKVQVSPYSASKKQSASKPPKKGQIPSPREVPGPHEVSVETWVQIVKAQQQIWVKPDGTFKTAKYNPILDVNLKWIRWNQERDAMLRR